MKGWRPRTDGQSLEISQLGNNRVKPKFKSSDCKTIVPYCLYQGFILWGYLSWIYILAVTPKEIWYLLDPRNDFQEFICSLPLVTWLLTSTHTSSYTPAGCVSWRCPHFLWMDSWRRWKTFSARLMLSTFPQVLQKHSTYRYVLSICAARWKILRHSLKFSFAKIV